MTIKTKIAAIALAALTFTGAIAATSRPAEAHGYGLGFGIAAGVIGAAVVGSAIAAGNDGYYGGYRHCGWIRQYDGYGNYIGRVRSCGY